MKTRPAPNGLREQARQAMQEADAETKQRLSREESAALQERLETLGEALRNALGVSVTPDTYPVTIDGLTFGAVRDPKAYNRDRCRLVLYRPCPGCGQSVPDEEIRSLDRLGAALASGAETAARPCAVCAAAGVTEAAAEPELSLAQRLEGVVRAIVREELARART